MSSVDTISPVRLNAQIAEIEQQRNAALTRCGNLAGHNAELIDLVKILRTEVERLEGLIQRHGVQDPTKVTDVANQGSVSTQ